MPLDVCVEQPDGRYSTQNTAGKRFHDCYRGVKVAEGTCVIDGHSFNQQLLRCVHPVPGTPSNESCTDLSDGYYPSIWKNCSTYHYCRDNKVLFEITCPEGMQFDYKLAKCLDSSEVNCAGYAEPFDKEEVDSGSDCLDKDDGYYPATSTGCKEFYFCKNQQKTSQLHCPNREAFDIKYERCIVEELVMCNSTVPKKPLRNNNTVCHGLSDGYYPNYALDCKRYFYCKNGHMTHAMTCPSTKSFDPRTKTCEPSSSVICSKTTDLNDTDPCNDKNDGYYTDPSTGCKNYYNCRAGRVIFTLTCEHGQAYDKDEKKCVPLKHVHCPTVPTTPPHSTERNFCQGKQDGFYPNMENACRTYYHCRTGHKPLEYKCNAGQRFDSVTTQCINEMNVLCGGDVDSCTIKADGYYPTYAHGCKTFYYCRNEIKIYQLTCPTHQIFDVDDQKCLYKTEAICRTDNSSAECYEKSDGYYGNYVVNCSSFFRCREGKKVDSLSCPNGTCFDETASGCVRSVNEINCGDLPDGYYMDRMSSCKSYHLCNKGLLHTERCLENTVFDLNSFSCKAQRNRHYCKQIWTYSCKHRTDGVYEDESSRDRKTLYVCRNEKLVQVGTAKLTQPLAVRDSIFFDCQHLQDGFYPDISQEANCSRYHVCQEERLVKTAQCPNGLRFHIQTQKCRPWDEVVCDSAATAVDHRAKSELSSLKTVSFHFHFQNGCSNVTLCFKTRQSFLAQCPEADISLQHHSGRRRRRRYCKIGNIAEIPPSTDFDGDFAPHDTLSTFDCRKKEDGYYTDPSSGCRRWHMCDAGRGYTYECESGKAFNILHKRCDDSSLVTCVAESWVYRNYSSARSLPSSFRSQTQNFRKQPTTVQSSSSPECYERSDGIYVDIGDVSTTCFRVYLCINNQLYAISCPFEENPISDEGGVTCKVKDDVKCMKGSADATNARINPLADSSETEAEAVANETCENQDDGFYVDVVGGCRSFYVCHQGAIKIYECPNSMMFNTETKTCDFPENVVCLIQATNAVTCPKHLTKLYPDHESDCQHYFGCSDGSFRYSTCPYGTLFDFKTSECVPRTSAVCVNAVVLAERDTVLAQPSSLIGSRLATPELPQSSPSSVSESSFDCSGRPDGFYPDYDQNCHVFYRCVRGKKFSHYCQTGQLFNSQLQSCDVQENVQCNHQQYVSVNKRK